MKKFKSISRGLSWLTAGALSALVAACGGGQSPILGADNVNPVTPPVVIVLPPKISPTVTLVTSIPNATGVSVNTKTITAAFSKPMDASTLNPSSFTLACPAATPLSGGSVTYLTASQSAVLTLPVGMLLPADTVCNATVTTAAKDTSGLALAVNFVWSFTTNMSADTTAPTVTQTINANGASNVATNTKVGATFSEAMNPLTLTNSSFTLKKTTGNVAVAGDISYAGVNVVFSPAIALAANTNYTATITTAATDLAGNPMASDYIWSWTTSLATDITKPRVTGTITANGAINVATNTRIGATFSESLNPLTVNNTSFTLKQTLSGAAVIGISSYAGVDAVFIPTANLLAATQYTATITTAVTDLAGNSMASDYIWSWTTAAVADTTAPLVTLVNPGDLAINVPVTSSVNATFNEAMDPLAISTANFSVAGVSGVVTFNALDKIATFTPTASLTASTLYTATVTSGVSDLAGNHMSVNKVWTFTTATAPVILPVVDLINAAPFGTFGGSAGMTNTGTLTVVNGDIGTIATGTSMVTGFHDTLGDIYTETPANIGAVNGKINSCTNSVTGPTSTGPNAVSCAIATQARLDAQTAYLTLVARPVGGASPAPGANLAGVTLLPGTYVAPGGSFMIQGGNLTLDAQGNANAVWIFQMASTLTVGGPGAAFPQSIILAGGALAKNVYWQVGSFATINAAGGGTMVGTIIAQSGASFSTAGNTNIVTLNGRVLSLGASVTLVDTVINVPAP
jgi:hypothetical protein